MTKRLIFMGILTSSIGASVISINLGFFQLSLFRMIIIMLIIFGIFETINLNKISFNNSKRNRYSVLFMIFWLMYGLFSIIWVKDYGSWIRAVFFLGTGVACVILFTKYLNNEKDILYALKNLSLMIILHNIIGWNEVITGSYKFITNDIASVYKAYNLPVSMFGNTNDFATYLLISIYVLYICLNNTKNIAIKITYIITIVSSIILLLMTSSRANIIGLLFSGGVYLFFSMNKNKKRIILFVFFLFAGLTIILLPSFSSDIYLNSINAIGFSGYYEGGSISVRINLIKNGFIFLYRTYGFGTGAGNIEYWLNNRIEYNTWGITNIHNWWMEILVGYGILIFILYIIFYFNLLKDLLKKIEVHNNSYNKISLGLLAAVTGYGVGSFSSSSNIGSEWLWVFWGIAIAYQGIDSNPQKNIKEYYE